MYTIAHVYWCKKGLGFQRSRLGQSAKGALQDTVGGVGGVLALSLRGYTIKALNRPSDFFWTTLVGENTVSASAGREAATAQSGHLRVLRPTCTTLSP